MGRKSPREEEWFQGHAPKGPPESEVEDRGEKTARGGEADAEEADAVEDDAGPGRKKLEPCKRARVGPGEERKPGQRAEQPGESHPTGQPRHIPGGSWLNKDQARDTQEANQRDNPESTGH
ncbi:hypothetical protein NDU88_005150 [Pleurodeles waltl]|uniref:Uncharacterized protein n=1 Tax=Pleurodeles waltl TaxID=8319 RepID=A0AAV7WXF9_PLEWA|nr:hypothetical protein NDU88_005150 [Pleurodeles waltl]